jgi:hypothetical protein
MLFLIYYKGANKIYRRFNDISDGDYGLIHNELKEGLLDYLQETKINYLVEKRILGDAVLEINIFVERERLDPNANLLALNEMERFAGFLENRREDLIEIINEILY